MDLKTPKQPNVSEPLDSALEARKERARAWFEELRDLMRSLQASRWQTLLHLELPSALPVFLGGLRNLLAGVTAGDCKERGLGARTRGQGALLAEGRWQRDIGPIEREELLDVQRRCRQDAGSVASSLSSSVNCPGCGLDQRPMRALQSNHGRPAAEYCAATQNANVNVTRRIRRVAVIPASRNCRMKTTPAV